MNLKKITTLFLTVLMLTSTSLGAIVEAATNIAPNPGFTQTDTEGNPLGWNIALTGLSDVPVVAKNTVTVADDGNALKIESVKADGGAAHGARFNISFDENHRDSMIPGEKYTISFQYKTDGGWHSVKMHSSNGKQKEVYSQDIGGLGFGPVKDERWSEYTGTVTVPKDYIYHWVEIASTNRNATYIELKNFTVSGVRRPGSNPVLGNEMILNGGFTNTSDSDEGWKLSEEDILQTEEGNTYASLTKAGRYAEYSFSATDADVYEITADVKSSISGALRVTVDSNCDEENKLEGDFFFNRVVKYGYTFVDSASSWNKIKFNVYPADIANKITLRFECIADDAVLAVDNLSVKPTKELISNGDFEGLAFQSKVVGVTQQDGTTVWQEGDAYAVPGWQSADDERFTYSATNAYEGTSAKLLWTEGAGQPKLAQYIKAESGKTYKFTCMVYAGHKYIPGGQWVVNSYTGRKANECSAMWFQPNANQWVQVEQYFTVPTVDGAGQKWNTEEIRWDFLVVGQDYKKPGNFYYVDNVSIQEVTNGVAFRDANAERFTSIEEAKGKDVYSYYTSTALPVDKEISLISALYVMDENQVPSLVDVNVKKGVSSLSNPLFGSIYIPDDDRDYKLSVFCLDSLTGLQALEEKVDLE